MKKACIFSWVLIWIFSAEILTAAEGGGALKLTSPEFKHNEMIPKKFTCQGGDVNPALKIEGVPAGAKSLVLIMDDPDATMGVWDHWVVYDIPPDTQEIKENSAPGKGGKNSFRRTSYGGPCPPSGTHRYFFKLYALDISLDFSEGADKSAVENAMNKHILDKAELIGLYKKQ